MIHDQHPKQLPLQIAPLSGFTALTRLEFSYNEVGSMRRELSYHEAPGMRRGYAGTGDLNHLAGS